MSCRSFALISTLALLLSACHGLNVQEHPLKPYPEVPEDAQPSPIGFNKLRYHIPTGTDIASTSPKGVFGLFTCGAPYETMQQGIIGRYVVSDNIKQIFNESMEAQGYDVTGSPGRMFDEDEDIQRTVYSVGARITNIRMDLCDKKSFLLGFNQGYSGEGEVRIEWTVYDLLHRRNVLKITTEGYTELTTANREGMQLILEGAFAAAAHNLGAEEEFRNLVVYGDVPKILPDTVQDVNESPIGMFDPQEKVSLRNPALSRTPVKGHLEDIIKTAVMIEAGHTHGSGFFISDKGHIVTNAHVVGNAFRVRVVTSGKEEKMIGEVIRVDRLRDVALIRLEEPLDHIRTLPIRTGKLTVGEDVYAVGAPRLKQMQDTVTKGIVSAHRYDRKERQPYIQADVDTYGGNSGGPLLDEFGNIVGISVSGYAIDDGDALGGLNNFIPIEEALKKLDITLN